MSKIESLTDALREIAKRRDELLYDGPKYCSDGCRELKTKKADCWLHDVVHCKLGFFTTDYGRGIPSPTMDNGRVVRPKECRRHPAEVAELNYALTKIAEGIRALKVLIEARRKTRCACGEMGGGHCEVCQLADEVEQAIITEEQLAEILKEKAGE